jgi:CheY-like chemotaxis protein
MDELELANAIVVDPSLTVRVVLMTGLGQELEPHEAVRSGICASLSKPIHRAQLRSCLRVALGLDIPRGTTPHANAPRQSSSREHEGQRLLLVEDNLINQKVAVAMLSSVGYRVDTVVNGAFAVRAAAAHHYDAILMDCQMPELNGYEATAAIRANEGSARRTPIIAMTAGARREDRDRCLAVGMDSYLSKPVSKDALLALVAKSIKNESARPGPANPDQDALPEVTIDPAVFDDLRRLAASVEDDFLGELVAQFVGDTKLLIADLHEALDAGDVLTVGRIAHSIKGSGQQLGGRRLARMCERLEAKASTGALSSARAELIEVEVAFDDLRVMLNERVSGSAALSALGSSTASA